MIKNILFDMGNVLIRFDRELFLDRLSLGEADRALLLREVFLSKEWVRMDMGTLDEPEAEALICLRVPEHLHGAVHQLVSCWDQPLIPIPGMAALAEELKAGGYCVYLLSNASRRQHEYWPRVPGCQFFDGTLISADEKLMKPHPDYYRTALVRFGLKPEECFFVDDMPANVEGALSCGIQGAVFQGDTALLRRRLREAGVNIRE